MSDKQLSTEVRNPVEVIRERIQGDWATLMPEEKWTEFVQAEIARFITDVPAKFSTNPATPSPLKVMIREELQKKFADGIRAELADPKYGSMWMQEGEEPGDAIKRIVVEAAPAMVQDFFLEYIKAIVCNMQSQQQFVV